MGSSTSIGLTVAAHVFLILLATTGTGSLVLYPPQAALEDNSTFNYIIVGGGSAGCVVARRLSEDQNNTVLLLEAGGDPPFNTLIAALFSSLPNTEVDYSYTSTRDDFAARGNNNYTIIQAGKMLGGSDSMNHFIHTRGTPSDYDCWAELTDDDSWKYDNILQYFIKSEHLEDAEILAQYPELHGTQGPMGISRQPDDKVLNFLKSYAEVGNPSVLELNANNTVGYTQAQLMFANSQRQSPSNTYLDVVKYYSNLKVSKNTRVTRVVVENGVAVSVEAEYLGKKYTFRANKEIILSAGVFNTPQLLMLSGIGPKEHLESLNITVLKDLPVGQNLVDQVSVSVVHRLQKDLSVDVVSLVLSTVKFPFPVLVGAVPLDKTQTCPDYQTFALILPHDAGLVTTACNTVFGLRDDICSRWEQQVAFHDSLYTVIALLQPESRGNVTLGSTDPFADPVITTGYYTKEADLIKMIEVLKDYISVTNTTYFKEINAEVTGLDLPECADKEIGSDEYYKCYISLHTTSPYHFVGTCAMGQVVDSKLRVIDIPNLRVVDASVMPKIPRAAPNAAVIMLAEKASDDIKETNSMEF